MNVYTTHVLSKARIPKCDAEMMRRIDNAGFVFDAPNSAEDAMGDFWKIALASNDERVWRIIGIFGTENLQRLVDIIQSFGMVITDAKEPGFHAVFWIDQ